MCAKINENDDVLKAVVKVHASLMMCELVTRLGIGSLIIINHLKHIRKVKKLNRWDRHKLNKHQKKNRLKACHFLLS